MRILCWDIIQTIQKNNQPYCNLSQLKHKLLTLENTNRYFLFQTKQVRICGPVLFSCIQRKDSQQTGKGGDAHPRLARISGGTTDRGFVCRKTNSQ